MRTDPKNTEYVVVEGGRRRDYGAVEDGLGRERTTEEEKERLEKDGGFGAVEKKVEDRRKLLSESERLEELRKRSERDWEDPYEMSKKLRKDFRPGRKARKDAEVRGEALKEKLSLGIELVEERDEDAQRAKFIEFGSDIPREIGDMKPLFDQGAATKSVKPPPHRGKQSKKPTADELAAARKGKLQGRLTSNTRAAIDPFVSADQVWQPKARQKSLPGEAPKSSAGSVALVAYDSDSS